MECHVLDLTKLHPSTVSCRGFSVAQKFPEALEAYTEAIELDGTNVSFFSNRAAVYFEQKEYEPCIAEVRSPNVRWMYY